MRQPGRGGLLSQSPYLINELLTRTLDIKGDVPADITPELAPVIVVADLSDQQYLWNRRGLSWGASAVTATSAKNGQVIFKAHQAARDSRKIIRVDRMRFWLQSAGAGPSQIAYKLWTADTGVLPVLDAGADIIEPGCRDARMGSAISSVMFCSSGVRSEAIADGDSGWIRAVAPTAPGHEDVVVLDFDPRLTMRPADVLQIATVRSGMQLGWCLEWYERDCSAIEYQGQAPP